MLAPRELGLVADAADLIHPYHASTATKCMHHFCPIGKIPERATNNLRIRFGERIVTHTTIGPSVVDLHTASLGRAGRKPHDAIVSAGTIEFNRIGGSRKLVRRAAVTAHPDVFPMPAVVMAPFRLRTMSDFQLVAVAVHVVHPNGPVPPPEGLHGASILGREAKRIAHHLCISVVESVVADRAPLTSPVDLKAARVLVAAHKPCYPIIAGRAHNMVPDAVSCQASGPGVTVGEGRDDVAAVRDGERAIAPTTSAHHPHDCAGCVIENDIAILLLYERVGP